MSWDEDIKIVLQANQKGDASESFTASDVEILFGRNPNIDEIFDKLDVDGSGAVSNKFIF